MKFPRNVDAEVLVALGDITDMDTVHTELVGALDGAVMVLVHMDMVFHTLDMVVLVTLVMAHFGRQYLYL